MLVCRHEEDQSVNALYIMKDKAKEER